MSQLKKRERVPVIVGGILRAHVQRHRAAFEALKQDGGPGQGTCLQLVTGTEFAGTVSPLLGTTPVSHQDFKNFLFLFLGVRKHR